MATWGEKEIKFSNRNYRPPHRPGNMAIIYTLPDPTSPTGFNQVIQQGPTPRKAVKGTLILNTYSDYLSLESDMHQGAVKELVAPEESGGYYLIVDLGEPDHRMNNVIFADVEFLEATPPEEPEGE